MRLLKRLPRIILGALALWWLWLGWTPVYFTLSENLAKPKTQAELNALPAGSRFLVEGMVNPASPAATEPWQGRFAYVHYQSQDTSTQAGKEQRIVLIQDHRPETAFEWDSGKRWFLPTKSYKLDHAPRIKPRFCPRKALGFLPVDEWHSSSRGFLPGEDALAYGTIDPSGVSRVKYLLQSPLESASQDIGSQNGFRKALTLAFKTILTIFVLMIAFARRTSAATEK